MYNKENEREEYNVQKKRKFTDENTSKLPERKTFGELRNYERR